MKTRKKVIISIIVILICIAAAATIFLSTQKKEESTLSISERRWIEKNQDKIIDVAILNNIPLFSYGGEGLFFDFIKYLETKTSLEFNKVPYNIDSVPSLGNYAYKILNTNEKPAKDDLIIFEDTYVAISKNNKVIYDLNDLKGYNIGLLEKDLNIVSNYLASNHNLKTFNDINELLRAFDNEEEGQKELDINIDIIIIPHNLYLNEIQTNNNYKIIFHLNEISKKYVLRLDSKEKTLSNIITTYFNNWNVEQKPQLFNNILYNTYLKNRSIDSKAAKDFRSKIYTYGLVKNLPYERVIDHKLIGINGEYLNNFSNLTKTEFEFIEYNTIDDLNEAISQGKIDVSFNYYKPGIKEGITMTSRVFPPEYVLLGYKESNIVVNTLNGLNNKTILLLKDSYLKEELKNNNAINIKEYKSPTKLFNNLTKDNLVLIDSVIYEYYKNTKFNDYKVIYRNRLDNGYSFLLKDSSDNKVFNNLFNNFIAGTDYKSIENDAIITLMADPVKQNYMKTISKYVFGILVVLALSIKIIINSIKKKKVVKKLNKEDKIKYTDLLTNLKNRNYLNDHIEKWEDNNILPQAIIVVDLNNIKYINDNFGHEEGDNVIKKAAAILINTQLENSEIMRTDGNEFLIYLVGHKEPQILAYTRKLYKEMKNIPHEFGAALGFSMIEDEIKTIDDAINEALLDMRTNKEGQNY
ncbi:MAG: GGDEF domain-containing protein [Bacilli bacterium]|nr:GGDEF domain-containing protein [Bacilli bacterium]